MIATLALMASIAACPADVPAAMRLDGVPATLVSGVAYEAALEATGEGSATGRGWTLSVFDRKGRGWKADLPSLGFRQAFSVGLTGAPYAVSGTYLEALVDGTTCTRTLTVSAAVERRVLGVVDCRRGAIEPRTLVVGCDAKRVRLRGLRWTGWNEAVAVGRGSGGVRVRLSRPEECSEAGDSSTRVRGWMGGATA